MDRFTGGTLHWREESSKQWHKKRRWLTSWSDGGEVWPSKFEVATASSITVWVLQFSCWMASCVFFSSFYCLFKSWQTTRVWVTASIHLKVSGGTKVRKEQRAGRSIPTPRSRLPLFQQYPRPRNSFPTSRCRQFLKKKKKKLILWRVVGALMFSSLWF